MTTLSVDTWALRPLTIDTADQFVPDVLIANANDANGRGIDLHLTNEGSALSLSGMQVYLVWRHQNGNQDLTQFTAVDASKGHYKVYYPAAMMRKGDVLARISVYVSGGVITGSRNFRIRVEPEIIDDDEGMSDETLALFTQAVIDLNELESSITSSEAARVSAESARASAEATRVSNENTRMTRETARINAEASRGSAETRRANAETARANAETERATAENARAVAETGRVSAESARVSGFSTLQSQSQAATAEANDAADNANNAALAARAAAASTAESEQVEYNRQVSAGVYEGRSLITILGASDADDCFAKLHARAQARNAAGIRIGDYIDVTPTVSTVNRGNAMRYRVAGIGHNYQFGDTACPWAFWMVPDAPVDMTGSEYAINTSYIYWNTTADNNGTAEQPAPYLASNLHAWEINEFLPALPAALQAVLVNHRILFETRYSASGKLSDSTGWAWGDAGMVFSLSETEVYGQCVWGTKGYSVGCDAQLPLFRDSRYRIKSRAGWWLRSVGSGSSANVCDVTSYGTASDTGATLTLLRPRPCFLVG